MTLSTLSLSTSDIAVPVDFPAGAAETTARGPAPEASGPQPLRQPPVDGAAAELEAPFPADWRGERGGRVDDAVVRLRACGPADAPTVFVLGGISADRAAARAAGADGWWGETVGPGAAVDTRRYRVLSADFFPLAPSGPTPLTTADYADVYRAALEALGVTRLHAVVGASFGGMVGLKLAERHPGFVDRLAVLCAAHRASPMARAWRRVQQRVLALGIETGRPEEATAIARELAMTTYRTAEEFNARFVEPGSADRYLEGRGRAYAETMSAARYLTLSAAIDDHDARPEAIRAATCLIAADTDRLVPLADVAELERRLAGPAQLHVLRSAYGHDAFLKDAAAIAAPLGAFLGADLPQETRP